MFSKSFVEDANIIASLQRDLNLATAFLLLTGQITVRGVFVYSGRFSLSLSGPIFGSVRTVGKEPQHITNTVIDIIDVLIAVLLIMDQIRIVGVLVGPGRFALTVTGPIFGETLPQPNLSLLEEHYRFFHQVVTKHFHIDPTIFKNFTKE
ncbi:hypothetical protein [Bacillus benzoevorans]|uniref:Uncharacterized protein n=1 Tax=Bacillus benzoevorans TaxID=1456 RepID=A0A7X0LXU1_9BACI|nr:hypothetical protein [Bacillus benzoevorans]MBB6446774.1 hypothetical protein [Bacillus benzoevorans]